MDRSVRTWVESACISRVRDRVPRQEGVAGSVPAAHRPLRTLADTLFPLRRGFGPSLFACPGIIVGPDGLAQMDTPTRTDRILMDECLSIWHRSIQVGSSIRAKVANHLGPL